MILAIRRNLHLHVGQFFKTKAAYHGPKTWTWWRLVSFSWVQCPKRMLSFAEMWETPTGEKPSTTYRLWVYFRWGRGRNSAAEWACPAMALDVTIDRRNWTRTSA